MTKIEKLYIEGIKTFDKQFEKCVLKKCTLENCTLEISRLESGMVTNSNLKKLEISDSKISISDIENCKIFDSEVLLSEENFINNNTFINCEVIVERKFYQHCNDFKSCRFFHLSENGEKQEIETITIDEFIHVPALSTTFGKKSHLIQIREVHEHCLNEMELLAL